MLLPRQESILHGKLCEIRVLLHRLFQDGYDLFLRPFLGKQSARQSPVLSTLTPQIDDLAFNRLPRIFFCLGKIAQAIVAIHIVQSVIRRLTLRLFLLSQEFEVALKLFLYEML